MKEKRIDKMTNDIVIFAKERSSRPIDKFDKDSEYIEITNDYDENCPFCRGNEQYTPNHTYEVCDENGWIVKSTMNKFPIIDTVCDDVYGIHEVMIETYRHNGNFYNMNKKEFEEIIKMYKNRYTELIKDEKTEYISIFKNYLNKAGASLLHPHSQIISLPLIPPDIEKELQVAKKYYDENNRCLYEDIIKEEIENKDRVVYNGEKILAMIPFATRYSGEVRILFKEKIKFEDISEEYVDEISHLLVGLFKNLKSFRGSVPFNLYIHNHPKNVDCLDYYNTHIHIVPRVFNLGGFELSTGMYSTALIPEDYTKNMKI